MPHRRLIVALLVLLAVALTPVLARAHADYERSSPPADGIVAEAPAVVELWFTQELFRREGENRLEVYGPDGARVDAGDARIDDDDRTHMLVSLLPDLPAGTYTVRWRSLSAEDGHPKEGEFPFTVDPTAAPAASPTEPAPALTPTPLPATTTPTAPALPPTEPTVEETAEPSPAAAGGMEGAGCSLGVLLVGAVALGGVGRRRR